jgi:hypothetical protein
VEANPADAANVGSTLQKLGAQLPMGWPNGHLFMKLDGSGRETPLAWADLAEAVLGWLITAFASLFGAPFWFDPLQSVARLKGAGPSPAERASGRAVA